jgi:hypothetical protein
VSNNEIGIYGAAPVEDKPLTPATIRERWDRSLRSTRIEREQAAVNSMFLRNKHWIYWNRASGRLEELPREPSRVRATVPRVGPDSRRILAKLMRRNLVFDVPPSSPDDAAIQASRLAEAALVQAQQGWEDLRLEHASACGRPGSPGCASSGTSGSAPRSGWTRAVDRSAPVTCGSA